ncbi:biotin/lipoyl-containing protein, partial [Luedemannella flava]|uniref:biotin/lipoyl-containing protein n=1 Tax=Luedemannella flava TaxID=349316 RepID=UPI0031CFBCA6
MTRVREFPLPDLGEGLLEGEILSWLVKVGDTIALNQPIVEVETAKAAVEIPAKWAGRVAAIYHEEGSTVEVGTPIIAIDTDPGAGDLPATPAAPEDGANGGRTPVLVGYGPRATTAARRPRKGAAPAAPAAPAA